MQLFPLQASGIDVDAKWHDAMAFCSSEGKEWEYQSDEQLERTLSKGLQQHYKHTVRMSYDKTDHPIFLVMSGPGTGKSRLLDEFISLAIETCTDPALKEMLENSYVFKVNFDNGTKLHTADTATNQIASRMYYQLHPPQVLWEDFSRHYQDIHLTPTFVLRESKKKKWKCLL